MGSNIHLKRIFLLYFAHDMLKYSSIYCNFCDAEIQT
jgi:hypothetical protein